MNTFTQTNNNKKEFYLILTLLCKFNENSCNNILFCPIFVPDRRGKNFKSIFTPENIIKNTHKISTGFIYFSNTGIQKVKSVSTFEYLCSIFWYAFELDQSELLSQNKRQKHL